MQSNRVVCVLLHNSITWDMEQHTRFVMLHYIRVCVSKSMRWNRVSGRYSAVILCVPHFLLDNVLLSIAFYNCLRRVKSFLNRNVLFCRCFSVCCCCCCWLFCRLCLLLFRRCRLDQCTQLMIMVMVRCVLYASLSLSFLYSSSHSFWSQFRFYVK